MSGLLEEVASLVRRVETLDEKLRTDEKQSKRILVAMASNPIAREYLQLISYPFALGISLMCQRSDCGRCRCQVLCPSRNGSC